MTFRERPYVTDQRMAVRPTGGGFHEGEHEYRAREDMLRRKYRSWRGRSGRTYMFSVYSPLECPAYEDAVLVVAKRGADSRAVALACVDLGETPDAALAKLRSRFSNHLQEVDFQIHVLADRCTDRVRLIEDITHARPDA